MQTSGWRQALGNQSSEVDWGIGLGPIQLPTAAFLGSHLDILDGREFRYARDAERTMRALFPDWVVWSADNCSLPFRRPFERLGPRCGRQEAD
jgi:hypothetical protein